MGHAKEVAKHSKGTLSAKPKTKQFTATVEDVELVSNKSTRQLQKRDPVKIYPDMHEYLYNQLPPTTIVEAECEDEFELELDDHPKASAQ